MDNLGERFIWTLAFGWFSPRLCVTLHLNRILSQPVHLQRTATISRLTRKQREQVIGTKHSEHESADSFSLVLTGFSLLWSRSLLSNEIYNHPVFKPHHVLKCWGDRVNMSFALRT